MSLQDFYENNTGPGLKYYVRELPALDFRALCAYAEKSAADWLYWEKPASDFRFLALDKVIEVSANGKNRSDVCDPEISKLLNSIRSNCEEYYISAPIFVGTMKFAYGTESVLWQDFNDSDWFVPRYLFLENGKKRYLIIYYTEETFEALKELFDKGLQAAAESQSPLPRTYRIGRGKTEDRKSWSRKIEKILELIRDEELSKIVLSRAVEFPLQDEIFPADLSEALAGKYPLCYIFTYRRGKSIFFGASPEKLALLHAGQIEADALAGSMPRGNAEAEDRKYGEELLNSEKNLSEQQAVVSFIVNSFAGFTCELEAPQQPILRKLQNIQHLWTPIRGKLCPGTPIMQILKKIHPTPAICGVPWKRARKHILQVEDHERGLYTGLIGWFGSNEEAEFAVAIRSALIRGKALHAYAGCGIVNGSNADMEYAESELKLKPIRLLFHSNEDQ